MPQEEREMILRSLRWVDDVVITNHPADPTDMSVCEELRILKPHIFANGGDRRSEKDIPEAEICKRLNVKMIFNVGGEKVRSSSKLLKDYTAPTT